MKKLLVVTDHIKDYGAEKVLMWVAKNVGGKNLHTTIACTYNTSGEELIDNVIIYNSGLEETVGYNSITYFLHLYKFYTQMFKHNHYDYVLSFGLNSYYILVLLKAFFNYKLVVSERNDPVFLQSFFLNIKRYLYRFADIVVFQTDGAKTCFGHRTQEKSVVIPNPVNIPIKCWKRDATRAQIASVGRLDTFKQKRQDLLLKAFRKILSEHPNYILNLYGDGDGRRKLELLAENLGIKDNVFFHGKISNVTEELLKNEIYVLTSDFEGIPNSLMEAMALGMPVVSTDCSPGGARLLIDNKINGLIVARGDIENIANSIIYDIEHKTEADAMAVKAREKMKIFTPSEIIQKWRAVFN